MVLELWCDATIEANRLWLVCKAADWSPCCKYIGQNISANILTQFPLLQNINIRLKTPVLVCVNL